MSNLEDPMKDDFEYECYDISWYNEGEGPPLIKKKSRLIEAVVNNHVEILRDLLDSEQWYNVKDAWGYNLLQIAILRDKKEAFDYMLSLPNFPIEYRNSGGETALVVALTGFVSNDIWMSEHFAYELIEAGACLNLTSTDGETLIHCALERSYYRVVRSLVEKGVDINVCSVEGDTALDSVLYCNENATELSQLLLSNGAVPSLESFEIAVLRDSPFIIQETIFSYLFDQYSPKSEIKLDVLLKLAENESPLFHELCKYPILVSVSEDKVYNYFRTLCSMNLDYLKLVMSKFSINLNEAFRNACLHRWFYMDDSKAFYLNNLNVMLESDLKHDLILYISMLNSPKLMQDLIGLGYNESYITVLYCFLLSYGLNIEELDLQIVYKKFGYCQLFKILLHMDVKMGIAKHYVKNVVPLLIYDINMDLDKILRRPVDYEAINLVKLCDYFAHPKLHEIYLQLNERGIVQKKDNLVQIPLLVQLARDKFRQFFIKKFGIENCMWFYTLLNNLPISKYHREIISYERKLY